MRELDQDTITDVSLEQMSSTGDSRFKQLMDAAVHTDSEGRYYLRTMGPLGYSIPMDGPVGDLIRAQRRHDMRPAHIHFLVGAPNYCGVTTAVYLRNDKYIESDTVFGVTESLIRDIEDPDPSSPFPKLPGLQFDFTVVVQFQPAFRAGRVDFGSRSSSKAMISPTLQM